MIPAIVESGQKLAKLHKKYDEEEQQRSLEWLKHRHSVNDMKAFESVIDSLLYYQLRETNPIE